MVEEVIVAEGDDVGADIKAAMDDIEVIHEAEGEGADSGLQEVAEKLTEAPTKKVSDKRVDEPKKEAKASIPDGVAPQTGTSQAPVFAPPSMSAEEKAAFDTLPHEAKQLAANFCKRRDLDLRRYLTSETQKLGAEKRRYAAFDEAIKPYEKKYALEGTPIEQVTKRLLEWQDYMDENPVAALSELASTYDLTPEQIFGGVQQQGQAPMYQSPEIERLNRDNLELKAKIESWEREKEEHAKQQTQARIDQAMADLTDFREATANGQKVNPYFDDVYDVMVSFIPQIKSANPSMSNKEILKKAYEDACWLNPDIRQYLVTQANGNGNGKSRNAKLASSSLPASSSAPAVSDEKVPDTLDDAIRFAMNKHGQ